MLIPIFAMLVLFLVVGQSGLEPPTSRLSVVCSSQLSYWPIFGGPVIIKNILFLQKVNVGLRFRMVLLMVDLPPLVSVAEPKL